MHKFGYKNKKLYCEDLKLETLVKKYGTPLYVYSENTISGHYESLKRAFSDLDTSICFAVKANANLSILKLITNIRGGFDVVSQGELRRVIAAYGDPGKCVFAGVAKSAEEIEFALEKDIYCFNVESEAELLRIDKVAAKMKKKAPVAVRVNPDVEAKTHAKVTTGTYKNKFGVAFDDVMKIYTRGQKLKNVYWRGVQMHIGSQLTSVKPFEQAVRKVAPLAQKLKQKYKIEFFSIGGGMGIVYDPALESGKPEWWKTPAAEKTITPEKYAEAVVPHLKPLGLKILLEPGRFIAGNAGVLISRVEYVKRTAKKNFVIVDAGMNDLMRPALYDSYHEIVPLTKKSGKLLPSDVVGPVCESADTFSVDRPLPSVSEGEYVAFMSAGAYGMTMASNYNTRPYPAEVLVKDDFHHLIRPRQMPARMWESENVARWLKYVRK
ncbi:MAG: diaminopimelate decarboxylase [Verrucomicrobia bacterium]|nr:diaminopimelate decarboxylase [Verrucomicrobiota bacterium]MCF7707796.1 diaminopimelate decarboxylase [Verrucomicrobiota bacterium]